jgi:Zn finger protein HypA/HybF involved in hydrogenase expression
VNDEVTPETLTHLVKVQPTRLLISMQCMLCHYEWVQPASTGRCPKCHGESHVVGAPRVSALRVI